MTNVTPIATARSTNIKTGDVPTIWIGKTVAEAKASCDAVSCPLRPWARNGEVSCYAYGGKPVQGFSSLTKSVAAGADRSIESAIQNRIASAKIIRVGGIGDPAVLPFDWWNRLNHLTKKAKLKIVAYTHGWRDRPDLVGFSMASCDSLEQAEEAGRAGFRAAIATREVTPYTKPFNLSDGSRVVVCPAIASKAQGRQTVTCNDCKLCVASNSGPHIAFPDHGPTSAKKKAKAEAASKRRVADVTNQP